VAGGLTFLLADITTLAVDAIVNATNRALIPGAGIDGAIRRGDGEAELLASGYRACLAIAPDHSLRSLAFPAISTGIYGFPADQAASIAVREICAALAAVDAVILVAFAEPDLAVLTAAGDA